jgi:hypothetical protein
MISTLIYTLTVAMSSPYSADVSVHLERCKAPVVNVQPAKPVISLQCENIVLTIDCSQGKKAPVMSLLSKEKLYLGHIECRRKQ